MASTRKKAKKGRKKRGRGDGSASDFVRSQPASMPAADVVAEGAKKGIKFSRNLVYIVRSRAGVKKPSKARAKKPRVAKRVSKKRGRRAAGGRKRGPAGKRKVAAFIKAAVALGFPAAELELARLKKSVVKLDGLEKQLAHLESLSREKDRLTKQLGLRG